MSQHLTSIMAFMIWSQFSLLSLPFLLLKLYNHLHFLHLLSLRGMTPPSLSHNSPPKSSSVTSSVKSSLILSPNKCLKFPACLHFSSVTYDAECLHWFICLSLPLDCGLPNSGKLFFFSFHHSFCSIWYGTSP